MNALNLPIIGYMNSPFHEKFGIPRQPNLIQVESYIEMIEPFNDLLAFEGIESFSHLWLIWQFHENKNQDNTTFRPQVRPPRLGGNQKVGVFATRSMYRPSPIGLSVVQLKNVEKVGKSVRVYVTGSDLLNGTPIVDIKPYIKYSDAIFDAESGYAKTEPARKKISWLKEANDQREQLISQQNTTARVLDELEQVLSLDPRPAYQSDATRVYGLRFDHLEVKFSVLAEEVLIRNLESIQYY